MNVMVFAVGREVEMIECYFEGREKGKANLMRERRNAMLLL
jgi:hypothetical protein